jgi:hypothetical protein
MPKTVVYKALAQRVLAVAVYDTDVGDWSAYIEAVPGKNHLNERMDAARTGEKLPYEIARILFPELAIKYEWRD